MGGGQGGSGEVGTVGSDGVVEVLGEGVVDYAYLGDLCIGKRKGGRELVVGCFEGLGDGDGGLGRGGSWGRVKGERRKEGLTRSMAKQRDMLM